MRVLLCLCLLWSGLLGAVDPAPPGAPEVVEPQAVVLWNRTIVELRQGIHGLSVEERAARLRFFITSKHTPDQIRRTVSVMREEMAKIDPGFSRQAAPRGAAVSGW